MNIPINQTIRRMAMTAHLSLLPRALCTAVLLSLASGAHAATLYYDGYGGFVVDTDLPVGSGTYANDADTASGGSFDVGADADTRNAANLFTDVAWGTDAAPPGPGPYDGRSGLALSRVIGGTVEDDAVPVLMGTLTHFNRPIGTGTSLQSTQMQWSLALFGNPGDAANAEASGNANAVFEFTGEFTLYNWETPNAGLAANGFRYFDGTSWVGNSGDVGCPSDYPAGTQVTPTTTGEPGPDEIFISDGNPTGAEECPDAHIYLPRTFPGSQFEFDGRIYDIEISGFYQPQQLGGELTDTFWACENLECDGTVRFALTSEEIPPPPPIKPVPALGFWGLLMTIFATLGLGGLMLRRRELH
jgi:hypothetical protein